MKKKKKEKKFNSVKCVCVEISYGKEISEVKKTKCLIPFTIPAKILLICSICISSYLLFDKYNNIEEGFSVYVCVCVLQLNKKNKI